MHVWSNTQLTKGALQRFHKINAPTCKNRGSLGVPRIADFDVAKTMVRVKVGLIFIAYRNIYACILCVCVCVCVFQWC